MVVLFLCLYFRPDYLLTEFPINNNCYYRMNHDEIKYMKIIEQKIDLLIQSHGIHKTKEQLLGAWVSEKELIALTGLSRNTLLKLRQDGQITRSTISGKKNYYRLGDFKKLLDKNEG